MDLGDFENSGFHLLCLARLNLTSLEFTLVYLVKPFSKSISEPLPTGTTSLPLAMSDGILIEFNSEPDQEHVLVDLDVQDDNNVNSCVFIQRMWMPRLVNHQSLSPRWSYRWMIPQLLGCIGRQT